MDDKSKIKKYLEIEPTGIDRYFALIEYKSKYVSNPNIVDKLLASTEENEWAKQFFVKEDGSFKTKKEVKAEIAELYTSQNMEMFDGTNDFSSNNKEIREFRFIADKIILARLLGRDKRDVFS
jgi:hypothetical protein